MKKLLTAASALVLTATVASAQSLLLNFHSTNAGDDGPVAAPYLTLDPAHDGGLVPLTDTSWNNFNTATASSSLLRADGSTATGLTVTFGNESSAESGSISFADTSQIRTDVALGTGGSAIGQQSLLGANSIYGPADSSAAARQGWLGQTDYAIGLRLDGLSAGTYVVYVLARNTNTNATSVPLDIYLSTGALSATYAFDSLSPVQQANIGYPAATYSGEYDAFDEGNNFLAITVTLAEGESLFLASRSIDVNSRGFLNAVEIVAVPEPEASALAIAAGLGFLFVVRRKHIRA